MQNPCKLAIFRITGRTRSRRSLRKGTGVLRPILVHLPQYAIPDRAVQEAFVIPNEERNLLFLSSSQIKLAPSGSYNSWN
jgi:hypothetical protein